MANSTFKNILLYGASMEMLEELFRGARHGTQHRFGVRGQTQETLKNDAVSTILGWVFLVA